MVAIIDGALLRFRPPDPDNDAARRWASGQIDYFKRRIARRQRELGLVQTSTWFLFAASFAIAVSIACTRLFRAQLELAELVAGWPHWQRCFCMMGLWLVVALLFLVADWLRRRHVSAPGHEPVGLSSDLATAALGLMAGAILTLGLVLTAALLPTTGFAAGPTPAEVWLEELLAFAVVLAATLAGAIRFVSDKSSWMAELTGYEHALRHFQRGQAALGAAAQHRDPEAERREVVLALGVEALAENENWLRSHRERPIEPIVGG
jgi:hypothetical protein